MKRSFLSALLTFVVVFLLSSLAFAGPGGGTGTSGGSAPEPSLLVLLGTGLVSAAGLVRKHNRHRS